MTWIRVDDDVIDHPKTYRLARLLGSDRTTAFGLLCATWGYAARHHVNGDLTNIELAALHGRLGLPVDSGSDIRQTLIQAGWIDLTPGGRYLLHDWTERQGKLIEHKTKQRNAKREDRQLRGPRWEKISMGIRRDRAGWRCECDGRCGRSHSGRCPSKEDDRGQYGPIKLEVAHINGDQRNHNDGNLLAMCRSCHKRYDHLKEFTKPGRRKELIDRDSDRPLMEPLDRTSIEQGQPKDSLRDDTKTERNGTSSAKAEEEASSRENSDRYYIACTVALNHGMQENPTVEGEWMPVTASSQVARVTWWEDGIPLGIVEEIILERSKGYRCSGANRGPRSLKYFDLAVREAWERGRQSVSDAKVSEVLGR